MEILSRSFLQQYVCRSVMFSCAFKVSMWFAKTSVKGGRLLHIIWPLDQMVACPPDKPPVELLRSRPEGMMYIQGGLSPLKHEFAKVWVLSSSLIYHGRNRS